MRLPSSKLKRNMQAALGEGNYLAGLQRDLDLSNSVRDGMGTLFGAAIYGALEELERACYSGMASTSPWRVFKQVKYRAELHVAQYIKSRLSNYVTNADMLLQNIEMLKGEQGEY